MLMIAGRACFFLGFATAILGLVSLFTAHHVDNCERRVAAYLWFRILISLALVFDVLGGVSLMIGWALKISAGA